MAAPARREAPADAKSTWCPGVRGFPCSAARLAGFVPVGFVSGVIGLAYFTAVPATLVPMLDRAPWTATALLVIFHFVFLNVAANYFLLVFADPGGVPASWKAPPPAYHPDDLTCEATTAEAVSSALESPLDDSLAQTKPLVARRGEVGPNPRIHPSRARFPFLGIMHERSFDGGWRYCRKCENFKPDRSHHCSMCGRCVLRMDHHCVFINNCVGFMNHKFFVCFILYAFIGCLLVCIISFPMFREVVANSPSPEGFGSRERALAGPVDSEGEDLSGTGSSFHSTAYTAVLLVGYILTSAFAFALGIFAAFHGYLVYKGRTTIEMYDTVDVVRARQVAEYDLGARANCFSVFGNSPVTWIFPVRYGIPGDGLSYARSSTCTSPSDLSEV